jgi:hypothetical protein
MYQKNKRNNKTTKLEKQEKRSKSEIKKLSEKCFLKL